MKKLLFISFIYLFVASNNVFAQSNLTYLECCKGQVLTLVGRTYNMFKGYNPKTKDTKGEFSRKQEDECLNRKYLVKEIYDGAEDMLGNGYMLQLHRMDDGKIMYLLVRYRDNILESPLFEEDICPDYIRSYYVHKKEDKFEGTSSLYTKSHYCGDGCDIFALKASVNLETGKLSAEVGDSTIYVLNVTIGLNEHVSTQENGIIFIFEDGTQYRNKDVEISVKYEGGYRGYKYNTIVTMTPNEFEKFCRLRITDIRMSNNIDSDLNYSGKVEAAYLCKILAALYNY